jgi:hypothetical protein
VAVAVDYSTEVVVVQADCVQLLLQLVAVVLWNQPYL